MTSQQFLSINSIETHTKEVTLKTELGNSGCMNRQFGLTDLFAPKSKIIASIINEN